MKLIKCVYCMEDFNDDDVRQKERSLHISGENFCKFMCCLSWHEKNAFYRGQKQERKAIVQHIRKDWIGVTETAKARLIKIIKTSRGAI